MDLAHISALLRPFLEDAAPRASTPHPGSRRSHNDPDLSRCHSEHAPSAGEEPAPSPSVSPALSQSISTYIDLLLRWNSRINLTSVRNPDEIVTRHFGESLFAARRLFPPKTAASDPSDPPSKAPAISVADLGSGAGFPGLPIKLWVPQIQLTLVESNHKKAAFLREAVRALGLSDVDVENVRAESLTPGTFDLVTVRALDHMEEMLPVAAGLVGPGGRLALFVGASQIEDVKIVVPLCWQHPISIPQSDSRLLLIGTNQSR